MKFHSRFAFLVVLLLVISILSQPVFAMGQGIPFFADSPYDLINAVNALRASNGLSPYSVNSILMYTAQNQADFMAANQIVTHSGPGGISLTDRILAAGYPLAGDLSLGGFRAENIISGGEGMSAQSAVNDWTGDAPHLNTMLSPNLTELGAGVAVNDGRVYYVIDAARPTSSGAPQVVTPVTGGGATVPAGEAAVSVVIISTPNSAGDVTHEVLLGQTLWQIAISYDVKIDEIKRLNNLTSDAIYPGEKLLIKKITAVGTETPAPMATETVAATQTAVPSPTITQVALPSLTATLAPLAPVNQPVNNQAIMGVVIGILVLGLLAGVFFSRGGVKERQ
jgi:LysM repeat protein